MAKPFFIAKLEKDFQHFKYQSKIIVNLEALLLLFYLSRHSSN